MEEKRKSRYLCLNFAEGTIEPCSTSTDDSEEMVLMKPRNRKQRKSKAANRKEDVDHISDVKSLPELPTTSVVHQSVVGNAEAKHEKDIKPGHILSTTGAAATQEQKAKTKTELPGCTDQGTVSPTTKIPKQRKAKDAPTNYFEDSGSDKDASMFEGESSDEWVPDLNENAASNSKLLDDNKRSAKNKKKRNKNKKNIALKKEIVTGSTPVAGVSTVKITNNLDESAQKVNEQWFGAFPRYSLKEGRPFTGFQDKPGQVFQISKRRAKINDEILDTLLKIDELDGKKVGPGIVPTVKEDQFLEEDEACLGHLLDLFLKHSPANSDNSTLTDKQKEVANVAVKKFLELLDPTKKVNGPKNKKTVEELDRMYQDASKRKLATHKKYTITPDLVKSLGFGEIPFPFFPDDDSSSLSEFDSDYEEKAKENKRNAGKWPKLKARNFKPSLVDNVVSDFLQLQVGGPTDLYINKKEMKEEFKVWLEKGPRVLEQIKTSKAYKSHKEKDKDDSPILITGVSPSDMTFRALYPDDEASADLISPSIPADAWQEVVNNTLIKRSTVTNSKEQNSEETNSVERHVYKSSKNIQIPKYSIPLPNLLFTDVDKLDYSEVCYCDKIESLWSSPIKISKKGETDSTFKIRTEDHLKCSECDNNFSHLNSLKAHLVAVHKHSDEKTIKCDHCDYVARSKSNMLRHIAARHGSISDKKFKCTECDYCSVHKGNLKGHLVAVHKHSDDKAIKCDHCDYVTRHKSHMLNHIAARHGSISDKKFKCTECDYCSVQKDKLKAHLVAVHKHSDDKAIKCDHCDYVARSKSNMLRHIAHRHGSISDKKFKCTECDYCSVQKVDLKAHLIAVHKHSDDKAIKCDQCDYVARSKSYMLRHIAHRHGSISDKKFKCTECDYCSVQKVYLKAHLVAVHKHSDDKAIKCDQCDYVARSKSYMLRHIAHRHGSISDKKFKCTECDYCSVQKVDLKAHLVAVHKHSDDKAIKCDHCDYVTRSKSIMLRHIAGRHGSISDQKR